MLASGRSIYPCGTTRNPNSRSAPSGTPDGASIITSRAAWFFGNAITSRILLSPAAIITIRSIPSAIPPCGGAPYDSASMKNPNRSSICSSVIPSRWNTRRWNSTVWLRIDPLPSSEPFSTRS